MLRLIAGSGSLGPALALIFLASACGGDDSTPAETPSAAASQSPLSSPGESPDNAARVIDLASEKPATVIFGADMGDYLNDLPVLTDGDFNGDGLDDLLIGARFGDGPEDSRQDSGEAYVIFGRGNLPEAVDLAGGGADAVIWGAAANDQLGFGGAVLDFNADGVDDIALGAPFARRADNGLESGTVYVFFGTGDFEAEMDLAEGAADVVLAGPHSAGYFGDSLASTDVNGDGAADLIVGATFARRPASLANPGAQAGAAYVIFGGEGIGNRDMAAGEYDAVIYGENDSPHPDELGDNVAGGDINGDGIGDVIVTAEAADGPENARSVAAEVHVIFGSSGFGGVYDLVEGDQDVSVWGAEQNDTLGFNHATGDVNGDGIDDLLMSARGGDGPQNTVPEAGEVHVVLGGDLKETIDLAQNESDAYVYGRDEADMMGYGLGIVDVHGDGAFEILAGVNFGDGPANARPDGGELFAIDTSGLKGRARDLSNPAQLLIYGAQADDGLGAAVTSADMDGDGREEIAVMALRADGPDDSRPDAGEIYIIRP